MCSNSMDILTTLVVDDPFVCFEAVVKLVCEFVYSGVHSSFSWWC